MTGADKTPYVSTGRPRRRNVVMHTTRVLRCRRLWPCRLDQVQANRTALGNYLDIKVPPVISGEYGLVRPQGAKRRGGERRPDSPEMTGGKCFSHALASQVTELTKKAGTD